MTRDGRGIAGRILMCIVLALILGSHCLVAEPQVVQPYSPEFSSAERSALLSALGGLEKLLLDRTLGSQVWQGQQGWDTHQFALFSAGVMEDRGYQVALVTSASWPGGSHTWVLIGVDLGGRTGWIPVEAAPGLGASQRTLGSVPWAASGSGDFDERYASFDEAVDLGPNLPPIAHIRPPMGYILVREPATFIALASRDADGEIIRYQWSVDGGRPSGSSSTIFHHGFELSGEHTVSLKVIDNRGAHASTEVKVNVNDEEPEDDAGGCGCGS